MNRVLIVSPYFPPSTVAGVHRARILAKHLPRWGWEPVVFCVHERYHEQELDPDLAALVDPATRVVKVPAWPTWLARRLGIGDLGVRGYGSLRRAIEQVLRREGADLLFVTVLPGFPTRMGPVLKRRYGLPFVVDYQDPWLPREDQGAWPLTKAWAVRRIAAMSEPRILPWADHITTVSAGTSELIQARYPDLDARRFSAIPIGGDTADFAFLRQRQRPCPWVDSPWVDSGPGTFHLCYVGNVWTRAHRTLRAVFAAIARLRQQDPGLGARLRLVFVGTSNQPNAAAAEVAMPLAREAGIADLVRETPGRVPYLDALNLLRHADLNLMIGSDEPHYTASKLYPVLLAGRPVLGVFHEASSVCEIAAAVGGVALVRYSTAQPVETRVEAIAATLRGLMRDPAGAGQADLTRLEPFLGPAIAGQFAAVFDRVVAHAG